MLIAQLETELLVLNELNRKSTKGNYLQSQFIEDLSFLTKFPISTLDELLCYSRIERG